VKKIFIILIVLVVLISIGLLAYTLIRGEKPEIRSATLDWGEVTRDTTEVITIIEVFNPNPFTIPVRKITSNIFMNDIKMATAETVDLRIEREGEFPIKVLTRIDNRKIPLFWAEHLKRGEKSEVVVDVHAAFDIGIIDFTFPFQVRRPMETDLLRELERVGPILIRRGKMPPPPVPPPLVLPPFVPPAPPPFVPPAPVPPPPVLPPTPPSDSDYVFKITLESLSGQWGSITPETTEVILRATISNENPYPIIVPMVEYRVNINNIPLAIGRTSVHYFFEPGSTKDITTTIDLETHLMDRWFITHIQRGEKSIFDVEVSLVFELPPLQARQLGEDRITVPVWTGTREFETEIFPKTIEF
jgi:LEA14-like dessication related protein